MIFPTLALWSNRDPEDALGRIDRALHDRNHRLSTGISVSSQFDRVHGALVVSQGNGKYLRIRHVVEASAPIPKSLRSGCREVFDGVQRSSGQIALLTSDLAEIQASVIEQLKCEAGKYVDRVLCVAVCDPGVWDHDFDGKVSYSAFCDATRLAELCGVTVIDSFPSRDLAAEGQGQGLEALPYWILFSDRNRRVASQSRNLVVVGDQCTTYALPPSDGLDSEVPKIRVAQTLGLGFLNQLIQHSFPKNEDLADMDRIYANGLQIKSLRDSWDQILRGQQDESQTRADVDNASKQLTESARHHLSNHPDSFADIIRTGVRLIVDESMTKLKSLNCSEAKELLVACPAQYEAGLVNQFTQLAPGVAVSTTRHAGIDQGELAPVVAAMLGLFNIDQMPANIPWLTGAKCQRILGRLTPGRPSSWRQLVRMMADFQPAPMKLKDAV
jgi:anhydro-N-acetylmuramic acid kinase